MRPHRHVYLMPLYTEDAKVSHKPWLNWLYREHGGTKWHPCVEPINWLEHIDYKRKGT